MAERDREVRAERQREGLIGRWSRRKAEARGAKSREALERAPPQPSPSPVEPPAPDAKPDTIDAAELPTIESLTKESDFTVFMRKGVPQELRRQALRKLWGLDPVLANLDGLLEYGEDYSQIGRTKMEVKTAYQIGRGFMRKVEELAERMEDLPEDPAAAPDPPAPGADTTPDPGPPGHHGTGQTVLSEGEPPAPVQSSVKSKPRRLPKRG